MALLSAGVLALTACGSGGNIDAAATQDPIVIGAVAAMTGNYGTYGTADVQGMQAEVDLINANGGVLGRQLKLVAIDDQSDPSKAVAATQQLLSSTPTPTMIHAGAVSVDAAAVLQVTGRAGVVTMTPASTPAFEDAAQNPFNYVVFAGSELQVEGTAEGIKTLGSTDAGILASADTGGQALAASMESGLPKNGVRVVQRQTVAVGATDMTQQLSALRSAGVKVIYAQLGSPASYVTLMTNIQSLGWSDVKVMAGTTAVSDTVLGAIPPAVAGQFVAFGTKGVARPGPDVSSFPENEQKFLSAYAKIGGPTNFMIGSINGADEVALTAWAIEKANSAETKAVNTVLSGLNRQVELPADLLIQVPHPDWSAANRGLTGADFSDYWHLVRAGQSIGGTFQGDPIKIGD